MSDNAIAIDAAGFVRMMRRLFQTQGVHLRELVQNSLEASYQAERVGCTDLQVLIDSDPHDGYLRVIDRGIGMTADELRTKLTVLFRSGWSHESGPTLGIGQFGFGFYSIFLVADEVHVVSRSRLQPEKAHRLTFRSGLENPVLQELKGDLPPEGTTVELRLSARNLHYADEDLIRKDLEKIYLYSLYPLIVNNRALGLPRPDGWRRQLHERGGAGLVGHWLQQRYGWDSPPLLVIPLLIDNGGWLAMVPSDERVPPVAVYRRGIAVVEEEIIPEPFNYMLCGIVDMQEISLKPDREALIRDEDYHRLKQALVSATVTALGELGQRNPAKLRDILHAHRQVLTLTMARHRELRRAVGPFYPVQAYRGENPDTAETMTIQEVLEQVGSRGLVWIGDPEAERIFANRARHLGFCPVLLPGEAEQRLVESICHELGVRFTNVAAAYLAEMQGKAVADAELTQLFSAVAGSRYEVLCYEDMDARLPVNILRVKSAPFAASDPTSSEALLAVLGRRLGVDQSSTTLLLVNCSNPVIRSMRQSVPYGDRERRLAKILVWLAKLAAGVSVPPEDLSSLNQEIGELLLRREMAEAPAPASFWGTIGRLLSRSTARAPEVPR
jgi:HSP90 family molecular chaperone